VILVLENKNKVWKSILAFLGLPFLIVLIFALVNGIVPAKTYNYSEILEKFKSHQVVAYEMNLGSGNMEIKLKDESVIYYTAPSATLMYRDIKDYINDDKEKNKNIESESKLKSIKIKRTSSIVKPKKGQISVLLPTSNNINKIFLNSTENYLNKTIEYNANTSDNLEKQEICQDGGMIAFRISNQNIGEYISNEGDEIKYDKSLLEKAGIDESELKFTAEIDLVIELSEDEKYKGTISLELPTDTFENRGSITTEITDTSKIIFKRNE